MRRQVVKSDGKLLGYAMQRHQHEQQADSLKHSFSKSILGDLELFSAPGNQLLSTRILALLW